MIKKFSEVLFEFENYKRLNENEEEEKEAEVSDKTPGTSFQDKFNRFKEFLSGITSGGGSQSSSASTASSTTSASYSGGSPTTYKDVDKMIELVVKYLKKYGITNPIVQKAILSCIGKESGFTATQEASYRTTSPARIREIFGARFSGMSDEEINNLKKDDKAFWEKVYGGEWGKKYLGNTQPGDGAKYLGRGFNGITGRAAYKLYSDLLKKAGTNVDLVANPEILEKNPEISAEINALYFLKGLDHPLIKKKYGNKDPNDFKDFNTAVKAVVNTNAGAGVDITKGFGVVGYNAAIAAGNRLGPKFDKAIAGSSDASRTA